MAQLNTQRILLGGVVAGIVATLVEVVAFGAIFNAQANAAMAALGIDFESGGFGSLALLLAYTMVLGIVSVWLYAAIRATYGPGPRTAVIAGLGVWALVFLCQGLSSLAADLFEPSFTALSLAVGLVESLLATLAGAYLYHE